MKRIIRVLLVVALVMVTCATFVACVDNVGGGNGITVTKIEVTKLPTKTVYDIGEPFSAGGGEITVTTEGASTLVIDLTDEMCGTVSTATAGEVAVEVTYENQKTSFNITVKSATLLTPIVSTLPKCEDSLMYGDSLPALVGGEATIDGVAIAGTFTLEVGQKLVVGNSLEYNFIFTPQDTSLYTLVSGKIKLNVSPKELTIKGATAISKVYDGNATAQISGTLEGVLDGDIVTYSAVGTFADKNVGANKTVTVSATLGGKDAANYTLANLENFTANITPKEITVIWENLVQDITGQELFPNAVVNTGIVGETVELVIANGTHSVIGSYPVSAAMTVMNENYTLKNSSATFEITGNVKDSNVLIFAINSAKDGDVINLASGDYVADLNIDKSLTIKGAGRDSTRINGHIIVNGVDKSVSIDGITVYKATTGNGSSAPYGVINITSNASVSIRNSSLLHKDANAPLSQWSTGVRLEGAGANLALVDTDINVGYYGIGMRNINQNVSVVGGSIVGWAAIMTSGGTLGNVATDTKSVAAFDDVSLVSRPISDEEYGIVVLQENIHGYNMTFNNCVFGFDFNYGKGFADNGKASVFDIRSTNNVIATTNCTLDYAVTTFISVGRSSAVNNLANPQVNVINLEMTFPSGYSIGYNIFEFNAEYSKRITINGESHEIWFVKDVDELSAAINSAKDGDVIKLANGTYVTELTINKAITLIGAPVEKEFYGVIIDGKIAVNANATIRNIEILINKAGASGSRSISIKLGESVTAFNFVNSRIATGDTTKDLGYASGIASSNTKNLILNMKNSTIIGVAYSIETNGDIGYIANISASKLTGYAAIRVYSSGATFNVTDRSALVGRNFYNSASNGYATIIVEEKSGDFNTNTNNTINIINSTVTNEFKDNDNVAYQYLVEFRSNGNILNVDAKSSLIDTRKIDPSISISDERMFLMLWSGCFRSEYDPVGNVFNVASGCNITRTYQSTWLDEMNLGENNIELKRSFTSAYKVVITQDGTYNFKSTLGIDPDFFIANVNGSFMFDYQFDINESNSQFDKDVKLVAGEYMIFISNYDSNPSITVDISMVQ